jgi:hypothetical protein
VSILASVREPGNLLILFLAFLEPLLILYLVYWRHHQRDANLDLVIKLFAVGALKGEWGMREVSVQTHVMPDAHPWRVY